MKPKSAVPQSRWERIRLFAMDVDGVLTDGTVVITSDGKEAKVFSILDGMGLGLLREAGLPTAWISGRASKATLVRAKELRITHLIQGERDKLKALKKIALAEGLSLKECAYMGDDFIDVPAMEASGLAVSVPTAMPAALNAADYVTSRPAGRGAVREVCDHILAARTGRRPAKKK